MDQPPLPNTPGPDASEKELADHHRALGTVFACRTYDDVMCSCMWCTRSDADLPVNRKVEGLPGVTRAYCSDRCGDTDVAYRTMLLQRVPQPKPRDPELEMAMRPVRSRKGQEELVQEEAEDE